MSKYLQALFAFLFLAFHHGNAQQVSGTIRNTAVHQGLIVLEVAQGSAHQRLDSTRIDASGHFRFSSVLPGAGFYRLVVNDTDHVDLILDPRETEVVVVLNGAPLQQHISIVRSKENERLWKYKLVSKETQAIVSSSAAEKAKADPADHVRLRELDTLSAHAQRTKRVFLNSILAEAPGSYFARAIRADQGLDTLQGKGPMSVTDVVDFSDPSLMRSAVYDRAIMVFLQNLNAVSEEQFVVASDTLIGRASKDPGTAAYMLEHLLDLFTTYGPELAAGHLVDRYIAPQGSAGSLPPGLQVKVADYLKVAVGAIGPDVPLTDSAGTLPLSQRMEGAVRTVLFFYSSTCDHCHGEIPALKAIFQAYAPAGLIVIGIALDIDTAEFEQGIRDHAIPWPSFSEFNGWGSKAAKAYHVRATPSFYLLDPERRILAKPVDAVDLENKLRAR